MNGGRLDRRSSVHRSGARGEAAPAHRRGRLCRVRPADRTGMRSKATGCRSGAASAAGPASAARLRDRYSARNATIGSVVAARRDGAIDASSVATITISATPV